LEDGGVGLDVDGNWAPSDGSLKLVSRVGLDEVRIQNVYTLKRGTIVLTALVHSDVWVDRRVQKTPALCGEEGVPLRSTLATMGPTIAINEELLGELDESTGLDSVGSLDGASGGE